jgi:hypothetical protein
MKWIACVLLLSACTGFVPSVLAQNTAAAQLKKWPDVAYRERAFQLFRFLSKDKQRELGPKASGLGQQIMEHCVTLVCLELTEAGVFIALDKPLTNDRLERLSPAARIFYEYYREARGKNPVFHDLYTPLPLDKTELYEAYKKYQREGRPDGERQKYEATAGVLDDVQARPTRNGSLLIAGSASVITIVGVGLVVGHLRRRFKVPKALPEGPPQRV